MNPIEAVVIPANGDPYLHTLSGLPDLERLVGGDGMLEMLLMPPDAAMYFNEEGKLIDLPPNLAATRLIRQRGVRLHPGDLIVGDAIIVGILGDDGRYDGEDYPAPSWARELVPQAQGGST